MQPLAMPDSTINDASAWLGEEMAAHTERWLTQLSQADIIELESAARQFIASGENITAINQQNFLLVNKLENIKTRQN